ncbi:hypothetical protein DL765_005531 [Monosporascus sp. GIB2]|nr:hypothetical protein DL765_005531 [Monosporascus sp. GIB2]
MRFLTLIPYLTLAVASVLDPDLGPSQPRDLDNHKRMAINPDAQVAPLEERSLEERACKYNKCKCQKVKQGQYCGSCWKGSDWIVKDLGEGGAWNHVYECNKKGGCCDYGYAKDCDFKKDKIRC